MKLGLGSIWMGVGSFCIDAVPHLREGYGLSCEGFFESFMEDAIVWSSVGVRFVFGDADDDADSIEMSEGQWIVKGKVSGRSEGGVLDLRSHYPPRRSPPNFAHTFKVPAPTIGNLSIVFVVQVALVASSIGSIDPELAGLGRRSFILIGQKTKSFPQLESGMFPR